MSHSRNEAVKAQIWRIDRALAGEEEKIVQEAAECAAKERSNHRNPGIIVSVGSVQVVKSAHQK